MAMQQEVSRANAAPASEIEDPSEIIAQAIQEVKRCLHVANDSLASICREMEEAISEAMIRPIFRRFNSVIQVFLRLISAEKYGALIAKALNELGASSLFLTFLDNPGSIVAAIREYKSAVLRNLAALILRNKKSHRADDEKDDALFSELLPVPSPEPEETEPSKKRPVADVSSVLQPIPKKSKIPALAALHLVPGGGADGQTPRKSVLVTRQKLRAAQLDPKGLLNLVGTSTNALERAKQLEMLKTSGWLSKNVRKKSFAERFHEAEVRFDLGMAVNQANDTLLFGQKVMSAPGFLSARNITDIQNNNVDGSTTWKHQNAFCKMIIAGCINQAKRITQKFDAVLHGSKPEELICTTHTAIKEILRSPEGRELARHLDSTEDARVAACDKVIKRLVQTVAPILPLTLRDKALDGEYLRTALQFLGAAEFLFAQYETDVRTQANPNGLVGLSSAMHSEFERAVVFNSPLKPLDEFMNSMKCQYQTSLGLGSTFPKDFGGRSKQRENRRRGGRFPLYGRRFVGSGRGLQDQQERATAATAIPIRGQELCFNYRNGRCHRGATCRYSHIN